LATDMKAVVLTLLFTGGVSFDRANVIEIPLGGVEKRETVLLYPKKDLTVTATWVWSPWSIVRLAELTYRP